MHESRCGWTHSTLPDTLLDMRHGLEFFLACCCCYKSLSTLALPVSVVVIAACHTTLDSTSLKLINLLQTSEISKLLLSTTFPQRSQIGILPHLMSWKLPFCLRKKSWRTECLGGQLIWGDLVAKHSLRSVLRCFSSTWHCGQLNASCGG